MTLNLSSAQYTALNSMQATQYSTSIVSSNVANADTEGYTRKITTQSTSISDGIATSVSITGVDRYADKMLAKEVNNALANYSYYSAMQYYTNVVSDSMGDLSSSDTAAEYISEIQSAFDSLAVTPESQSERSSTVSALQDLCDELNQETETIQNSRANADKAIADTIDDVNEALEQLESLNEAIAQQNALGNATGDLEDKRDVLLQTVCSAMNVSYFYTNNNQLNIYTSSGHPLLDSQARTIEYNEAGAVSSDTSYSNGNFDAIDLGGYDLTEDITGGTIGSLIKLRDETLPAMQEELDELATNLMDEINAIHNQGTAYPAPNALTGTTEVVASDALSAAGTVRIGVTDDSGTVISFTDLDLSTCSTNQDVCDAIDAIAGVSASFDSDGQLVISADNSDYGISINEMDSEVGADSLGFSNYFGMNDLLTGTSAANISVNASILEDASKLAIAEFSSSSTLAVGDNAISSGDATIATGLSDLLSGSVSFDAAGNLSSCTTSFSSYASNILSDVANIAEEAANDSDVASSVYEELADSYSSATGVNLDEEAAKLTTLENIYAASAAVFEAIQEMYDTMISMVQ
jgi:flagellar hook-associated protein 1 FlgK